MTIKRQYLKTKPICKVTFKLEDKSVYQAKTVHLLGEFNNWNSKKHPMKNLKDGSFKIILNLKTGQEYQFRYLVNSETWKMTTRQINTHSIHSGIPKTVSL